jgi:hypothetical protein
MSTQELHRSKPESNTRTASALATTGRAGHEIATALQWFSRLVTEQTTVERKTGQGKQTYLQWFSSECASPWANPPPPPPFLADAAAVLELALTRHASAEPTGQSQTLYSPPVLIVMTRKSCDATACGDREEADAADGDGDDGELDPEAAAADAAAAAAAAAACCGDREGQNAKSATDDVG